VILRLNLLFTSALCSFHLQLDYSLLGLLVRGLGHVVGELGQVVVVRWRLTCELVLMQRIVHVLHHLLLHARELLLLALGAQDAHRLEIKSADSSHECFFKTFLHVCLFIVIHGDLSICVL
jgi:translation initiation factor 2 gamma subunit (eIF-2gamma)